MIKLGWLWKCHCHPIQEEVTFLSIVELFNLGFAWFVFCVKRVKYAPGEAMVSLQWIYVQEDASRLKQVHHSLLTAPWFMQNCTVRYSRRGHKWFCFASSSSVFSFAPVLLPLSSLTAPSPTSLSCLSPSANDWLHHISWLQCRPFPTADIILPQSLPHYYMMSHPVSKSTTLFPSVHYALVQYRQKVVSKLRKVV